MLKGSQRCNHKKMNTEVRQKLRVNDLDDYYIRHELSGDLSEPHTNKYCTIHFDEELSTVNPSTSVVLYNKNSFLTQARQMHYSSVCFHKFCKQTVLDGPDDLFSLTRSEPTRKAWNCFIKQEKTTPCNETFSGCLSLEFDFDEAI